MNSTVVPYTRINLPPRGSFPARTLYSPLLKTKINNSHFTFDSVVDSGADFCVFPAEFGEVVGLKIETGKHLPTFGVGGRDIIFFHKIKVSVMIRDEVWGFECHAGFSKKMNVRGVGLLGREGFFDLFQEISFNQNTKMFRLKG